MTTINAGNKGIINLGNTCYMNSVLQCLSHLITFHPNNKNFYESCKKCKNNSLIESWFQFQREMWNNDNDNSINPKDLINKFSECCKNENIYFENFMQNDVSDFLINFLDLIHSDIKKKVIMEFSEEIEDEGDKICVKSNQTWKNFYENNYSYIIENFYSQIIDITSCPKCNYYTTSHDPIQIVTLELDNNCLSLEDCLNKFIKKKQLDDNNKWRCDECNNIVNPIKQTKLWKTSDNLIILLKIYNKNNNKIQCKIKYPLVLDLKDYNINWGYDNNKYLLQGFCVHSGCLEFGHYYSVCRNYLDKKWYQYDDDNLTEIDDNDILNYNPYIFFYRRK
jgi:ubiquitin carboxyl-terminal hydrolase 8